MKKIICLLLVTIVAICACACGGDDVATAPVNGILDTKTGKQYRLTDAKSVFDADFGESEKRESDWLDENGIEEYKYLDGYLSVSFKDGEAVEIEVSAKTGRFEFYEFTFSSPLTEIRGDYEETDLAGTLVYRKDFAKSGEESKSYSDKCCTVSINVEDDVYQSCAVADLKKMYR